MYMFILFAIIFLRIDFKKYIIKNLKYNKNKKEKRDMICTEPKKLDSIN